MKKLNKILIPLNVENKNHRTYIENESLIKCINDFNEKSSRIGGVYGEYDYPDYDSEKELEISNFLHGFIINKKINSDISIKSHIKNNETNGWYLVVLNKHSTRGNELHFFSL